MKLQSYTPKTTQGAITTLQQMSTTPITGQLLIKGGTAAVIGAVLGIIISLVVNCTLVEISMSAFFALYFGLLFISVGCVILWRISTQAQMVSTPEESARKKQLQLFASLIVVSGFLCFILEKNWFVGMSPVLKIPLYSVLGVSVSFALTFSVVDMINYLLGFLQVVVARPLVESTSQVYLVLFIALIMGGTFGFIFGVMDVEDEVQYQVRLALLREEHYCYPIGALLGGIGGFGNEYLRQQSDEYTALQNTEFDDDI
ncbi:hypothetical protein FOL47_009071 [Perkinsus chesapeaki]|uniref:Transmembrane protein n=1 Tax=Perkinsus chesapeaki TaxID=330153 RepID=A0A7J6MSI0_PERCH|nr:hypothetical protein FOL47_009071 [Perkinsus chesapeaki]